MKTVFVVAGTRPEIIKMAPIVKELRRRGLPVHFCFSGQHVELARPFLELFELKPDSQLEAMVAGQGLGALTARAVTQLDSLFGEHADRCGAVLVQGDTTTAFAAALAAFYHRLPVGHVEAGLRTSTIGEPFPEELNRRLITRVANWHYAPTAGAKTALLAEQVPADQVVVTGNTGIDSFLWAVERAKAPHDAKLAQLGSARLALVTVHRRESIGEPLKRIAEALAGVAGEFRDVQFVLPVHKNPLVSETLRGALSRVSNIHLTEPLEYLDLAWAMSRAELILSDSGGIQEEAPSLGKPVLVLRNETERPEAVEFGTSILVGSDREKILSEARSFLSGKRQLKTGGRANPYGDGQAAPRIVDHLLTKLG